MKRIATAIGGAMALSLVFPAASMGAETLKDNVMKRVTTEIPGAKTDHKGLEINPTPQSFAIDSTKRYVFGETPKVKIRKGNAKGLKDVPGAYMLTVGKKGVEISGHDETGIFYGEQTLSQLMRSSQGKDGYLPYMQINDYPALPRRSVIEGFYGEPWSHRARLAIIDYLGRNKMNEYVYGPKDDPYHRTPSWRLPYPAKEAANIRELVEAARRNHVNFVWAVHPGEDIRWNQEDYDSLLNKFNMMYDLGVRSFAIFFDDIDGDGRNPMKQVELLNRINREFVQAKGDVGNLIVCPTDYSRLWASTKPEGAPATYGRELDKSIDVFYTGDVVCSDLTHDTLDFFDTLIQRPAYWWWNFPVTDYRRDILMQGPVYGLENTVTDSEIAGFGSNPMEHPEASMLALYSVADYTWNPRAYNPLDSWERALVDRMPEAADAYRTLAIHSADTETGYRRDESWETFVFEPEDYTKETGDSLKEEFGRMQKAAEEIEAKCVNPYLLEELKPWLRQLAALGTRGKKAVGLLEPMPDATDSVRWNLYVDALLSPQEKKDMELHNLGTRKMQPFIEKTMRRAAKEFYRKFTGNEPRIPRAIGTFDNLLEVLQAERMLYGDTLTCFTTSRGQKQGDWIGLDLLDAVPVESIQILQGRDSADRYNFMDNALVQISLDGENWNTLGGEAKDSHDIFRTTEDGKPATARYVRLLRLDSERTNRVSVRDFRVNTRKSEWEEYLVKEGMEPCKTKEYAKAFDRNPLTSIKLEDSFKAPVTGGDNLVVLCGKEPDLKIDFLDCKGGIISSVRSTNPFISTEVPKGSAAMEMTGEGTEIFEIIVK